MRALSYSEFGRPGEVLAVNDIPLPEPGPGQVRVRTRFAPIHNHDLLTVMGRYGIRPDLPALAGSEAGGTIEALGEGVTGLEVGQRVSVGRGSGTWAESFLASASAVIPVPDALSDEQVAQLGSMPFSAISVLDSLGLAAGDWLVLNAGNGAVGRMVAQLAESRGIGAVSLVRRADAVASLAAEGVPHAVATDDDGWRDRVAEITGGAPILGAIDSVGGASAGELLSLLGTGGTLVVFGAMESPALELASTDIIFKQLTVRGFWGTKVSAATPAERQRELFAELIERIVDGTVTLPVDHAYPLEQIAEAAARNFAPGRAGKVLLQP